MQPPLLPGFDKPVVANGERERLALDDPNAELVLGLVYAVGTDYKPVLEYLTDQIQLGGYAANPLRITDWFGEAAEQLGLALNLPESPEYERISLRIDAGNQMRSRIRQADMFALYAASKIFSGRESDDRGDPIAHKRMVHILASLKRPEEIETLRKIYGPGFFVISIFADESQRAEFLTNRKGLTEEQAAKLIERDQKEKELEYGQRTRDTFQMADVFVALANHQYEKGLTRFLRLIFGDPFATPTRDEHAMFLAYAASLRSGDLSRQVGAALACADGDVISLGCNDVPAPGGGLYCSDDGDADKRDHKRREDSNEVRKRQIIDNILLALKDRFFPGMSDEELLTNGRPLLMDTPLADVTEFGRAVHAEMDALMAAGRIGVSFRDATLYTTTFPCHTCTRHIIAAGVKRVVYIEPYPKSLATELHDDAITITNNRSKDDPRIPFQPFLGIGPRRFFDLFSLRLSSGRTLERKTDGAMALWDYRSDANPRVPMPSTSYLEREQLIHKTLRSLFFNKEELPHDTPTARGEERRRILGVSSEDGETSRKLA
ncbi:MAG TPA: anti-phage dCTP deaminase [Bryobacteraceae bacterium]|jgi:deoxycytidylate deaminase|nr:anti-phage dCTP deaminase [Bryobacteraceae bacterium]